MSYNVLCVFIKLDCLVVHGFCSVDKETETPSLQLSNAGSWCLSSDALSHGKAPDISMGAPEDSFSLSLTAMRLPGDLWILTAEEQASSRQRKKQHKPSSTMRNEALDSDPQSVWGQAAMEEGSCWSR